MANTKETKRYIAQILNELGIRKTPILCKYLSSHVDNEEWGRNKYFLFRELESRKSFELKASSILDLAFNFRRCEVYIVRDHQNCLLIANEDMIIYRQGQRKVYCYRIDMDATYRLDNILLVDDAYTVTRSHKKPRIEPDKEKTLKPKLHA